MNIMNYGITKEQRLYNQKRSRNNMPTYEYLCLTHNAEFEEFHSMSYVLEGCPVCKEKGTESCVPKRLISGGSGRGIMGDGQDYIDKVKADGQRVKKETYADSRKYANILGESKYNDIQTKL